MLDALCIVVSILLAGYVQPELRRFFPQLRSAVQFREDALLV
jgi:hypothetical protein